MDIKEYISKLCNKEVTNQSVINLSSAQKSRLHSWLSSRSINFDEEKLNSAFNIDELLNSKSEINKIKSSNAITISKNYKMKSLCVGVDIQRIDELFPTGLPFDPKSDGEMRGIYSIDELSYSQSKPNPLETLVGIFAVKEAVLKCKSSSIRLSDIVVHWNEAGAPEVPGYEISISHSGNYVVAIAIAINFPLSIKQPDEEKFLNSQVMPSNYRKIDWVFMIIFGCLTIMEISKYF